MVLQVGDGCARSRVSLPRVAACVRIEVERRPTRSAGIVRIKADAGLTFRRACAGLECPLEMLRQLDLEGRARIDRFALPLAPISEHEFLEAVGHQVGQRAKLIVGPMTGRLESAPFAERVRVSAVARFYLLFIRTLP